MERHSFRIVSGESPETVRKLCLSIKFPHQELGETTVFYTEIIIKSYPAYCASTDNISWNFHFRFECN